MVIKNATVLTDNFSFKKADVKIQNEKIIDISDNIEASDFYDAKGCYLVPGFVDAHTHGCVGFDTCDANQEGYEKMAEFYASKGVTSFLFTTMTLAKDELISILSAIDNFLSKSHRGAIPRGVYLEGPFISETKKGAQDAKYIAKPSREFFDELNLACGNRIRVVTVAPEAEGTCDFVSYASRICNVSIAHTDANFEEALSAIKHGASNITHLFNAMPPLHHRNPGVIGAGFDCENVGLEMICDGIHLNPAIIRSVFKLAEDRVVLISDSMMASGLSDGKYSLGGQEVFVKDKVARLESGTIAGSASNLHDCVKNCIAFGIKPEIAIKSATINPAKLIGMDKEIGSIAVGKRADLVILDGDFDIRDVFIGGEKF